jgi:hypothetical protein
MNEWKIEISNSGPNLIRGQYYLSKIDLQIKYILNNIWTQCESNRVNL